MARTIFRRRIGVRPVRSVRWRAFLVSASSAATLGAATDSNRDIKPIFSEHCYACHGPEKHKRGLRLDLKSDAMKGGDSGAVIGETDDIGWNIVQDPIHINDLHATMLHLFGLDHTKLTYRFQGRDFRLTDVAGKVVAKLLA